MTSAREQFLAGDSHEDVAFFLSESFVSNPDALLDHGEPVDGGILLVVDGESGRNAFQSATGVDLMGFTQDAMSTEGSVERDLTDGLCPDDGDGDDHAVKFVFAFSEAQNEAVGNIYAEGDVMHAYAKCTCDASYSDRWVIDQD